MSRATVADVALWRPPFAAAEAIEWVELARVEGVRLAELAAQFPVAASLDAIVERISASA